MCEALLAVRQRTRGPLGSAQGGTAAQRVFQARRDSRPPRRVRMRWRPSEEPLGGAKMTTDQIAEARRAAREWKPN